MFSTSNMHTLRNNYVHITSTKHVCVWIITYFQHHSVQIWAFFYFSHFTFTYVLRFYKAFNFDLPNSKFTWYDMWLWLRLKFTVSLSRIWFIDEMNPGNGYYSSPDPYLGNQMAPKIEKSTEPFWRKLRLKYEI